MLCLSHFFPFYFTNLIIDAVQVWCFKVGKVINSDWRRRGEHSGEALFDANCITASIAIRHVFTSQKITDQSATERVFQARQINFLSLPPITSLQIEGRHVGRRYRNNKLKDSAGFFPFPGHSPDLIGDSLLQLPLFRPSLSCLLSLSWTQNST